MKPVILHYFRGLTVLQTACVGILYCSSNAEHVVRHLEYGIVSIVVDLKLLSFYYFLNLFISKRVL